MLYAPRLFFFRAYPCAAGAIHAAQRQFMQRSGNSCNAVAIHATQLQFMQRSCNSCGVAPQFMEQV